MADISKYIEPIVSGILAGGASGVSSVLAFAKDLKKRLTELETKLGQSEEPKTGIFLALWTVEESLKRLKRQIEGWEDDPPEWAKRLVSRSRSNSTMSLDQIVEVENRIDGKIRTFNERIKTYQDNIENLASRLRKLEAALEEDEKPDSGKLITRAEYERDSKVRTEELLKIRESLASANGLLRGVMAAFGYLDPIDKKEHKGR